MGHPIKRSLKNYLINRHFQLSFLFRFFLFTLLVLTIGGAIQYYISNRTILKELEKLNKDMTERQMSMINFLNNYRFGLDYQVDSVPPELMGLMEHTMKGYNNFLQDEIKFVGGQVNRMRTILGLNTRDLISAYWGSLLLVGLGVNILFALLYGIFLTHRLAGNHYRLQKFARQLQEKDLATPLTVRKKDFFQETALEFEKARKILQDDLNTVKRSGTGQVSELLNSYRL